MYPDATVSVTGDLANGFSVSITGVSAAPTLTVLVDEVEQGFTFQMDVDGATGPSLAPFIYTGNDGTRLDLDVITTGSNMAFKAVAEKAEVFVQGGNGGRDVRRDGGR